MKYKIIFVILFLMCLSVIFTGCSGDTQNDTETIICAKCGGTATTTISGPAGIMESNGIPLSKCKKTSEYVYTAYICDSCLGPVYRLESW